MTTVITRSPLQSLNMVTTQGLTRRRSGQGTDEEGKERAQKRPRVDEPAQEEAKQPNGKKTAQKKSRSAYDEDVDGFSFRKRPKIVSSSKGPVQGQPPEEDAEEQQQQQQRAQSTAKTAKTAKEKTKKTLQPKSATNNAAAAAPKRRSARLSGEDTSDQASRDTESVENAPVAETEKPKRQSRRSKDAARITPVPKDGPLQVGKQRETKIALPFADTPIIDRNREMRDVSNSSRRRSSSAMRGRRASSLMNSGSSSEPHAEVKTEEFYKHISQELPERERMRLLLTWCGTRALSELPKSRASGHFNAIRAARTIQDELLRDFTARPEMSDWYSRPEEPAEPMTLVKKANPRNQQNAAKLVELEQQAKRLEMERESWDKLLGDLASSLETRRIAPDESADYASAVARINPSILDAPGQKDALAVAASYDSANQEIKERVQTACDAIEFAVDNLAHSIHQAHSFQRVVDQAAEQLLGDTAKALDRRDRDARERSGMDKVGVGDILRGIGKAS